MKVIIAGGREFKNYHLLKIKCDHIFQDTKPTEIVSGKCPTGADLLGERYAIENTVTIKSFPANWEKFGRSAGPKRNKEMALYADALIAFWDGKSPGTKSMINLMKDLNKPVRVIYY